MTPTETSLRAFVASMRTHARSARAILMECHRLMIGRADRRPYLPILRELNRRVRFWKDAPRLVLIGAGDWAQRDLTEITAQAEALLEQLKGPAVGTSRFLRVLRA